ncbi:MAG: colanic acid biosynthesis glycosyltransferase WcaL [Chlorobiales bacterium]|nr:colanic acid biosynthesis glycosyltransferase WcaL [Chlorobiales bacterium]
MPDSPKVAVYIHHYLSISSTFLYRQLVGVHLEQKPIVLTSGLEHLDLFPYEFIYHKGQTAIDKVWMRLVREATGRYKVISKTQFGYWKDILAKHNISLIHAHFGPDAIRVLPLAKTLGLPLLVSFHGYDASSLLRDEKYRIALKELFGYASVIAVSKNMAARLVEVGEREDKIHILYYGIPVDHFRFIERVPVREKVRKNETIRFLQVSNFVEKKGHRYTLEAFQKLLSVYPNCTLTLAGDGTLKSEMTALAETLGIADKVIFPGKVSQKEVIQLMENADVFVHHSVTASNGDQEGIPNVLMEAMAMGLPVISTYHSGIAELVRDEETGFLVKERDVDGYKDKMIHALECGPEIGLNARRFVEENFNMDHQNRKLAEIYQAVLALPKTGVN